MRRRTLLTATAVAGPAALLTSLDEPWRPPRPRPAPASWTPALPPPEPCSTPAPTVGSSANCPDSSPTPM
ncbi:hypothetical protein ACQEV9_46435 [Streptomyces chartreusis]|uniref:hypothetical protein n=1 Tax=Streptomyces chartreusis TaxID=1969 RepID=UPI003D8E3E4B